MKQISKKHSPTEDFGRRVYRNSNANTEALQDDTSVDRLPDDQVKSQNDYQKIISDGQDGAEARIGSLAQNIPATADGLNPLGDRGVPFSYDPNTVGGGVKNMFDQMRGTSFLETRRPSMLGKIGDITSNTLYNSSELALNSASANLAKIALPVGAGLAAAVGAPLSIVGAAGLAGVGILEGIKSANAPEKLVNIVRHSVRNICTDSLSNMERGIKRNSSSGASLTKRALNAYQTSNQDTLHAALENDIFESGEKLFFSAGRSRIDNIAKNAILSSTAADHYKSIIDNLETQTKEQWEKSQETDQEWREGYGKWRDTIESNKWWNVLGWGGAMFNAVTSKRMRQKKFSDRVTEKLENYFERMRERIEHIADTAEANREDMKYKIKNAFEIAQSGEIPRGMGNIAALREVVYRATQNNNRISVRDLARFGITGGNHNQNLIYFFEALAQLPEITDVVTESETIKQNWQYQNSFLQDSETELSNLRDPRAILPFNDITTRLINDHITPSDNTDINTSELVQDIEDELKSQAVGNPRVENIIQNNYGYLSATSNELRIMHLGRLLISEDRILNTLNIDVRRRLLRWMNNRRDDVANNVIPYTNAQQNAVWSVKNQLFGVIPADSVPVPGTPNIAPGSVLNKLSDLHNTVSIAEMNVTDDLYNTLNTQYNDFYNDQYLTTRSYFESNINDIPEEYRDIFRTTFDQMKNLLDQMQARIQEIQRKRQEYATAQKANTHAQGIHDAINNQASNTYANYNQSQAADRDRERKLESITREMGRHQEAMDRAKIAKTNIDRNLLNEIIGTSQQSNIISITNTNSVTRNNMPSYSLDINNQIRKQLIKEYHKNMKADLLKRMEDNDSYKHIKKMPIGTAVVLTYKDTDMTSNTRIPQDILEKSSTTTKEFVIRDILDDGGVIHLSERGKKEDENPIEIFISGPAVKDGAVDLQSATIVSNQQQSKQNKNPRRQTQGDYDNQSRRQPHFGFIINAGIV